MCATRYSVQAMPPGRDAFTAEHWNGLVGVAVHEPTGGGARPRPSELAQEFFGRALDPEEWAVLVGAPDGATVDVISLVHDSRVAVRIAVEHPWFDGPSFRFLYRDREGRLAIKNETLFLKAEAPRGVGARILAHQVRAAAGLGVSYLAADAAGGPGTGVVGYLVWPRLGFNGPIPPAARRKLERLPTDDPLRGATDVLDLVSRRGGRQWWTANGSEFPAVFDLADGSFSRESLDTYTASRGISV